MDIASISIGTGLNLDGFFSGLKEVQRQSEKFEVKLGVDSSSLTKSLDQAFKGIEQKTQKIAGRSLTIKVDDSALTKLNKHFDLKKKHFDEVNKHFKSKPFTFKVDPKPFAQLEKSLDSVSNKVRQSQAQIQSLKNTAASVKVAGGQRVDGGRSTQELKVAVDSSAIAKSFKESTKDLGDNIAEQTAKGVKKANQKNPFKLIADTATSVPKTIVRGFYEGVGLTYSQELTKGFVKGIEGKFNTTLENIGEKSSQKILAGGQKIGDRLLKKMGIAEGFKGLEAIASNVNEALQEIIPVDVLEERLGQVEGAIGRVLDGLLELDQAATMKGLQGLGKAFAGVGSIPVEGIDRRRSRILQNSAQMARARAEELKGTIPSASPDAKRIMIISGGFAGVKGKSSQSVSERFGLVAGKQAAIDYIDNEETDTTANLGKAPKWLGQILSRFGKQNVIQGYNKDAIEAAAKALAYQQQNPELPINFVGYSGGGYVAKEAVEILGAAGVQSKGVGIGTPMFGLTGKTKAEQFQAYMGQNDPLSKLAPALRSPNLKILKEAGAGHRLSNYLGGADLQKELDRFFGMKSQAVSAVEIELHGFEEQVSDLADDITKVLADPKQAQFFKKTGLYQAQLSSIQSHRSKLAGLIGKAEGEVAEQIEQYDEALAEMEGFMRQSYGVRGEMSPAVKATAEQKAIARPRVEAPPKVEAPVAPVTAAPEVQAVKAEAAEAKKQVEAIAKAAEVEDKVELEAVKAELNKYTVDILREFSRLSGRGGNKARKEDLVNDLTQNVKPAELDRVIESVKPQISIGAKGGLRLKKITQSPQEAEFVAGIKQIEREINDDLAKLDQYQGKQRDEFLKTILARVDAQVAHLDNVTKELQASETRLEAGRTKGRLEQTYRQFNPEVRLKQSQEFKQQLGERSPNVSGVELAKLGFNKPKPPVITGDLVQGQALTTYKAILESMAKASSVALDPDALPKLVVDDAKLQRVGAKALYNIKHNIITIGSEIEDILKEGAEALESNSEALADIVHEARHAFQFNFGKDLVNLPNMATGWRKPGVKLISDEYVDPRTKYAASKSTDFASSQVQGGLPRKSKQMFYNLEVDAYAFERYTPKIMSHAAQQMRLDSGQFAMAPQTLSQTRSATKNIIEPLLAQFKTSVKQAFTYLIEQVKVLTAWLDKLKGATSGVVEGVRNFVSSAASAVNSVAATPQVAAKFDPDLPDPIAPPTGQLAGRRVKRGSRVRNIVANVIGEETAQGLDQASGAIAKLPAMANKATDALSDMVSELANFAAQQAQNLPGGGLISKFLEDSGRLAKIAKPLLITLGGFVVIKAIAGMFMGLAGALTPVALEFEKFNRILSFTEGSAAKGAAQIERIRDQSRALGTDVTQALGGYTQLAAAANETSLEGAATEQLQTALETASAAYALDADSQKRLYLASSQVISKGSVSSEEIRQQIGEVLPGAYQIAARSMGMTGAQFGKQLELGNVQSASFIPKFSQQLQAELSVAAASGADSTQASINRMNSAITELQATVGAGILPAQKLGFDAAAKGAQVLADNADVLLMVLSAIALNLGAPFAASLAKSVMGMASLKLGVVSVTGAVRAALPAIASMAKSFLWVTLVTDLMNMFGKATEDGAGSVRDFADSTEESYNKYLELTGRATEETNKFRNAFEGLNELEAPSLLENSLTGNALKTVLGERSGAGLSRMLERSLQGDGIGGRIGQALNPVNFVAAQVNRLRGGSGLATYAEQQANDLTIAANEAALNIEQIYSEAYSMLGTDGQGVGDLGAMLRIDEDLKRLQAQRQTLRPEDDAGRRALQEQETALLAEREQASKSVGAIQGQLATYEAGLEDTRAKIEEMLAYGDELPPEVQEQLKNRLEATNRQIEENQQLQAKFTRAINTSADAAKRLQTELKGIGDRLTDANSAAALAASQDRLATAQAQLSGDLTPGEAQYAGAIDAQEALNTRIRNNSQALREYKATLESVQAQEALKQANIDPSMGLEAMRSQAAKLTEGQENTEFSTNLQTAINAYEQIQTLTLETADLESQMADSQVQAKESLTQSARQVSDFFKQITRSTEEILSAIESADLNTEIQQAKTSLQSKLSPFTGRFFSDFVSGFGELIDLIFQPLQNALDMRSQIAQINNQRADQALQLADMQRNLYGGGSGGATGAASASADVRETRTGTLAAQEYGASRSGGARRHAGQDLDYGESDYAQSFLGGVVTRVGSDPGGYGNYIDVFNSALGVVERIAEFDTRLVEVGQTLAPGQNVGQGTQDTGVIHYEIRTDINGQGQGGSGYEGTVDPIDYLEQQGIFRREGDRLIPLQGNVATVDLSEHVHFPGDGHSHDMADFGLASGAGGAGNAMQMDFSNLTIKGVAASAEQIQNAQIIAEVGRSLGASQADIQAAIATAIQESTLQNLTGGDRDSLGLFQQRPSMEWGTREQISDPRFAAESFFTGRGSNIGLLEVDGADRIAASHRVQRSAHPDAPAQWMGEAGAIVQAVSGGGGGVIPGGMPQQGLTPQQQAQLNSGMSTYNSAADSQIEAVRRLAAANDAQAALQLEQSIARQQRSLETGVREITNTVRDYQRAQEDAALEVIAGSPVGEVISQTTQLSRELADKTQEQSLLLRDAQDDLANLRGTADFIREFGDLDPQLQTMLPGIEESIAATEAQVEELQQLVNAESAIYEERIQRLTEQYREQRRIEREAAQVRTFDLQLQRRALLEGLEGNATGQSLIETQRNIAQVATGYDEQLRELEDQRDRTIEYLESLQEAQQLAAVETATLAGTQLDIAGADTLFGGLSDGLAQIPIEVDSGEVSLAQEELAYLDEQIGRLEGDREIEIDIAMIEADRILRDAQREMTGSLRDATAQMFENQGDPFSGAMVQQRGAEIAEAERYRLEQERLQSMQDSGYYSVEAIAELRGQAEQLNQLNLSNIDQQFKDLGETITDVTKNAMGTFFSDILSGTKSVGDAFKDFIGNMLNQVAQLASNALLSEIFGGSTGFAQQDGGILSAFGGANKQKSGGGIGGFFSSVMGGGGGGGLGGVLGFASGLLGFNQGGSVPGGYGGGDRQPAMLEPGEFVIRKEMVRAIGRPMLEGLNSGRFSQLKEGGFVDNLPRRREWDGKALERTEASRGDRTMAQNTNSVVNVTVNSDGSAQTDSNQAGKLGKDLEAAIVTVLQKNQRPGGALYKR